MARSRDRRCVASRRRPLNDVMRLMNGLPLVFLVMTSHQSNDMGTRILDEKADCDGICRDVHSAEKKWETLVTRMAQPAVRTRSRRSSVAAIVDSGMSGIRPAERALRSSLSPLQSKYDVTSDRSSATGSIR